MLLIYYIHMVSLRQALLIAGKMLIEVFVDLRCSEVTATVCHLYHYVRKLRVSCHSATLRASGIMHVWIR